MRNIIYRNPRHRGHQKGAITMFSAVLILILLTEMIIYAVQVGVFEQRKSSNEMKQKLAFHTADSAIQVAKQYLSSHINTASTANVLPDGTTGWLVSGSLRWKICNAANMGTTDDSGEHPCFGEPVQALRDESYFYSFDDALTDEDIDLPLDLEGDVGTSASVDVRMHALLCMLDIDRDQDPIVQGCTTLPTLQDSRYYIVTLLARGKADCVDGGYGTKNCTAEALIADKIGSYGPGGNDGGPGAPLTARTNVPLSGTVEIVPNPNGGGIGVPISSWVNSRTASADPDDWCALGGDPISPNSGSYATCEAHEWYGQDTMPSDFKCPSNTCSCDNGKERLLTYAQGQNRKMGIDIVPDPDFPCDLWDYTFGKTPEQVKEMVEGLTGNRLLTDCSSLDDSSKGIYWVSGSTCSLKGQVGGKGNPVILISAAADTRVSAGAELFGVLFVTEAEVAGAEFTGNGHATIYGAVIMDAVMEHFNGTFQIVYIEDLVKGALDTPLQGAVAGGWTDFHTAWQ